MLHILDINLYSRDVVNVLLLQVWQAIEKVLLEDSLVAGGASEDAQLTELSPVPQLHLQDTTNLYCPTNTQSYDNCKVTTQPATTPVILISLFLNKTEKQRQRVRPSSLSPGKHP